MILVKVLIKNDKDSAWKHCKRFWVQLRFSVYTDFPTKIWDLANSAAKKYFWFFKEGHSSL